MIRQGHPREMTGPLKWLRDNLFNNWYNGILTVISLFFIFVVSKAGFTWIFFEASWEVIPANLNLFMTGMYPPEEKWRIWTVVYMLAFLAGISAGIWGGIILRFALISTAVSLLLAVLPFESITRLLLLGAAIFLTASLLLGRGRTGWRSVVLWGWVLSFPLTVIMLRGFGESGVLPAVMTTRWGGLLLTLILASVSIAASFPLGILLALGRRSRLPAVSWFSISYIEVVRGIPLVTILFMSQIMLPIFLPDFRIDKIIRAMIGLTLFSTAYMAENVRGGLQGVPRGQYEAAEALGLSYSLTMVLVILPQALRSVIPAIVGHFISLFKDTSLVAIIGLLDLLGIARSIIANPDWLGLQTEVYLFAAFIYFMVSYSMSRVSRRIELALGIERK